MIRKSVQRFSEKIMLKQKSQSAMAIQPHLIALQERCSKAPKISWTPSNESVGVSLFTSNTAS